MTAINELPVPRGHAAVIVFHHRDLDDRMRILRRAGVPALRLEHHDGELDDLVKVGTVHRARGLDFRAVLAVQHTTDLAPGRGSEQELRESRERQYLVATTRARDFLWWGVVDDTVRNVQDMSRSGGHDSRHEC